jgi:hypothetical protein
MLIIDLEDVLSYLRLTGKNVVIKDKIIAGIIAPNGLLPPKTIALPTHTIITTKAR